MSAQSSALDAIPGYCDFLNKIANQLKDVPPCPIFASGALFPSDHAWSFKLDNQDYMLAGEAFWNAVPAAASAAARLFSGIPIVDIDDPRNARVRAQVMDAIAEHLDRVDAAKP